VRDTHPLRTSAFHGAPQACDITCNNRYLVAHGGDCKNAYSGGTSTLRKPDAGKAFQAGNFLLCFILALQVTNGLDGTEFSGGWLTGPLLSMADIGTLLFILALVLTFFFPRVAAVIGLVSSLLCVPLCCFFIAPVPFAYVFAPGHEFKVQQTAVFHWHTWPVVTLFAAALASFLCVRRFAVTDHMPRPRRARLA